ncbi:hypothetical protein E2C01_081814 [Portunus trituberculatus]|uniref:Uncharacterized protein n=1 Tax=Portunus trituberculatus TaxID=210409 RepID=A0A5B7IXG5_PORTR|nr:hypothetical protein [Portunus trituberculatus]
MFQDYVERNRERGRGRKGEAHLIAAMTLTCPHCCRVYVISSEEHQSSVSLPLYCLLGALQLVMNSYRPVKRSIHPSRNRRYVLYKFLQYHHSRHTLTCASMPGRCTHSRCYKSTNKNMIKKLRKNKVIHGIPAGLQG